ncbi:hypothetical protein BSU04_27410 [Caballeronia sordidicola]|uniref:Uncharacterized protein n=1 Tax=Caballeronia sordidicola TaxID=196367 RepID=A0A226WVT3_CABSO|nr:hypothetical protein BSU04_27410 [Caballeronia sordidicola]
MTRTVPAAGFVVTAAATLEATPASAAIVPSKRRRFGEIQQLQFMNS